MFKGTGSLETKTRYSTHLNQSEQTLDLRKHSSLACTWSGKRKRVGVISSSVLAQPHVSPKHAVSCAWDESFMCRPPTSLGARPGPFILMVSSPRPALGRVHINKACLLKKWSGNGEGQKTDGEISGQKSAALSQLGDCDRCCQGHTEERWWDVGIPLFTYSHDRPFFGSPTMCIPLCSQLGVQQWASLTLMIVLSSFSFWLKTGFPKLIMWTEFAQ